MRSVSISNLKNHLSRYLRHVRSGEVVVVLDRERPVAEIRRIDAASSDRLGNLVARGIVRAGDPQALASYSPPVPASAGVLEALLDERRTSR